MRKTQLVDCNPRWVRYYSRDQNAPPDAIHFDCPEGHEHCDHVVPFTPNLAGGAEPVKQSNGAQWRRTGDTFETLVLSPSILTNASHPEAECHFHGFIGGSGGQTPGAIEFCGDSR